MLILEMRERPYNVVWRHWPPVNVLQLQRRWAAVLVPAHFFVLVGTSSNTIDTTVMAIS